MVADLKMWTAMKQIEPRNLSVNTFHVEGDQSHQTVINDCSNLKDEQGNQIAASMQTAEQPLTVTATPRITPFIVCSYCGMRILKATKIIHLRNDLTQQQLRGLSTAPIRGMLQHAARYARVQWNKTAGVHPRKPLSKNQRKRIVSIHMEIIRKHVHTVLQKYAFKSCS